MSVPTLVLDTNIVLDMLVFNDASMAPLELALASGAWDWIATSAMRSELERVLAYPQIARRLLHYSVSSADVMAQFDVKGRLVDIPAKAKVTCSDPDDQKFIDLAVAHQSTLLSKDKAVISMRKRLAALDVQARVAI